MKHYRLSLFLLAASLLLQLCMAGKNKHGGNNRLIELLTAGIVAKVLQKNDGEGGGGGGGGGYYTIPIPLHMGMGSQRSHSHVTEKIIPIPIPHHTTRIIHINAGSHGAEEGGHDHHGGGGYGDHHGGGGGYGEAGHYDGPGNGIGGGDHHDDHHHHRAPTIQQLLFHDGGVYGMPQSPRPPHPHPAGVVMRRPVVGMVPHHPVMPMGMMPPHHSLYRPPAQALPAVSPSRPMGVRVRHYYPLASQRHRLLAYPTMPQFRYHPIPPRPW